MDEVSISFDAGQNLQHRKVPRGGPIPPFVPARPATPNSMGGIGGGGPGWGPSMGGRGPGMGMGGPGMGGPGMGGPGLGPGMGAPGLGPGLGLGGPGMGPGMGPGGSGIGGLGPGLGGGGPGSGPGMAFMSFNLGNTAGTYAPPPRAGIGGGSFGGGAFEDEPPLLEELGINIPQILQKLVSVLNPIKVNPDLHEEGDLSGPLILCMLFGLFQLLGGKVHFGVILGWTSVASGFLYGIFNLLVLSSGQTQGSLDLYRCCSLVGYSLFPLVLFSSLSLFIPHGSLFSYILGILAVLWCTRTCSSLFVNIVPHAEEHRYLIAYACLLTYAIFSLLVIF